MPKVSGTAIRCSGTLWLASIRAICWKAWPVPAAVLPAPGTMQSIKKSQAQVHLYAKQAKHKTSNETEHIKELEKLVD